MNRIFFIALFFMALVFSGCSGNAAEQLFETAQLEKLQNNPQHARELCQELIRKYPDSEYAVRAKIMLESLQDE